MSTLPLPKDISHAREGSAYARLLPTTAGGVTTGAAAVRYGPFEAGDQITVVASGAFHILAGGNAVTATTSDCGPWHAGVHDFTIPESGLYFSIVPASGSITQAAYKS